MDLLEAYRIMSRSRFFEEGVIRMSEYIHGTYHLAIGQEAAHTGLAMALSEEDWIVPTHRCHGYNVARGSDLGAMYSEMLGSRHGLCKGLGGSMHMTDISTHDFGSSAVVGSGVSLAGGIAYALSEQKKNGISVAISGDGASSRGTFHEMMNMASVFRLPLLFFVENNHYGMSASSSRMISTGSIASRADGYSMPHLSIDGNDVESVYDAVSYAREKILSDRKPFFIEADTYRFCGHSRSDKCIYRSREEEEEWLLRDPVRLLGNRIISEGIATRRELDCIATEERTAIDDAIDEAMSGKDDILSVEEMLSLSSPDIPSACIPAEKLHMAEYREAIGEAIDEILSSDPDARLIGEDIGTYGGCFGVTRGLLDKHPDKLLETPVAEEAFTGMAVSAAAMGLHPIVEIMYGDFSTLASDAIINHAAKLRFMSAGQLSCPMILRAPIGGMTGHGPQHTQCLETMFLSIPGLIIVAPSDPYSAKALLKSAAMSKSPVLFFEHKALYRTKGETGDSSAVLPLGKAIIHGKGDKLLVVGYSRPIHEAMEALSAFSDDITFIDLATIKPLDEDTLKKEFRRVGRALIVQDTPVFGSVGESVFRILMQENGCSGDIRILSALDSPVPASAAGENMILLSRDRIYDAAVAMMV